MFDMKTDTPATTLPMGSRFPFGDPVADSPDTITGEKLLTALASKCDDTAAARTALGVPTGTGTSSGANTGDQDLSSYATSAAVTSALALKSPLASPTFTGTPAAPTASPGTNSTQLATTAFVQATGSGQVNAGVTAWLPSTLGAKFIEEWRSGYGLYQDSGATNPVSAEGQTVAAWVGVGGNKLTTTGGAMVARWVNGRLTPVSVSDLESAWVLPGGVTTDRRDFGAWMHLQAGSGWTSGYLGLGSDRGVELSTFQDCRVRTYDPIGSHKISAMAPLASPMLLGFQGTGIGKFIRRNSSEFDADTPLAAGTVSGGFIGSINNSGSVVYPAAAIWHGIFLTKSLSAGEWASLLAYSDGRLPRPSDTAPPLNIVIVGDSNSCGTGAGGVAYPWLWSADGSAPRIVSSTKSGQFFSAPSQPINGADNSAQIDAEYRSGARNILVIMDTNDFSSLSAATALSNRESWAATRQGEGWEVWQPYMPIRVAPYGTAAAYKTLVETFNTSLASSTAFNKRPDLYAAFGGAAPPNGNFVSSDGIHWTAVAQRIAHRVLSQSL